MDRHDIMHRFANLKAGRNGHISAGNVKYEGRNYYSYGTIFGQWLDVKKRVVAIFDGPTSISSGKHKLTWATFPGGVHVFPLDFEGSYSYGWHHCNLIGAWADDDSDFKLNHRMIMIRHYVRRIYNQLRNIRDLSRKDDANVNFGSWMYVEELCGLYRDTSISKYLKWEKDKELKKLAKMLNDDEERNVAVLVDALFGEGTFLAYMNRTEKSRKAERTREKMVAICHRLGIQSPYENVWFGSYMPTKLKTKDIRKLTPAERLDLHFKALEYISRSNEEQTRQRKYFKGKDRAFQYITGIKVERDYYPRWGCSMPIINSVHNMFTGRDYNLARPCPGYLTWCDIEVNFDYDQFRNSENKEEWIRNFYAKCEEVERNVRAISTLRKIKAHTKDKRCCGNVLYVIDDYFEANVPMGERDVCVDFIRRQDEYSHNYELQTRAEEIARAKREEERKREIEYRQKIKAEQIEECRSRGLDGCRDLWRNHFMEIGNALCFCNKDVDDAEFFFGGNVLLRLSLSGNAIETSKHISIPVEKCKKMWKIVQKWHNDPSSFKPCEINTLSSGKYTIVSYKDDILTSGCHQIPYMEMERVMSMVN